MEDGGVRAPEPRWPKLLLAFGLTAFTYAVVSAYRAHATGYELSIYDATPVAFWAGIGVAMLVALVVPLQQVSGWVRTGSLSLGGLATIAVVGLPVIRGYFFYGSGDALSHLGFAKVFVSGADSPLNLLHPGVHIVSILLDATSGTGLQWSFMVMVVVFFFTYLLFVPLSTRAITGNLMGMVVGLFGAMLLLPINNISVHPVTHPTSQAILFFPFIVFLLVNYITQSTDADHFLGITPLGILLSLSSVAIVLIHPQQALNVLLVFGTIVALRSLAQRFFRQSRLASYRSLFIQTVFLFVVFLLWAPWSDRTTNTVYALVRALTRGANVGDEITGRGVSLAELGGSLEGLFLKLFAVSLVFSIITGVFVLWCLSGRLDRSSLHRNALVKYLGLSLVPVFGMFALYFVASATTQHFRHLGFMMAIVTIISAVAITHVSGRAQQIVPAWAVRGLLIGLFVVMIPLSVVALHPSPYIFQDNSMVSEAQVDGYEVAIEHRDPEIGFAEVRSGPMRFVDAVLGRTEEAETFPGRREAIPEDVFNDGRYDEFYDDQRYVVITAEDRTREVELYQGFRYSSESFETIEATTGVARIQSNGEFDLYLIPDQR